MGSTFVKIISKTLPAGSWSVWGIANTSIEGTSDEVTVNTLHCELRLDNNFIGGATDRRIVPEGSVDGVDVALSMFGGAQALAGGSEISLWCNSQHTAIVGDALIMAITLGGFQ
jgi:hypothetical protein